MDVVLSKEGWQRVRFLAKNVPAMGYRGYAIKTLDPPSESGEAETEQPANEESPPESWAIENEFYRLDIDQETGGIRSLIDKTEQRELVDRQSEYALNQYLYVSGGDESLILRAYPRTAWEVSSGQGVLNYQTVLGRAVNLDYSKQPAELTIHEPNGATLVENRATPLGKRLIVETSAKNTPLIRTEYLLYDATKRVDIVNTVQKDSIRKKEGVYFAFPFAAEQPQFEYQIQNGWLRPNDDQLPGACRE